MTDLHETGDRRHTSQIDSVGWMFAAVVVAITAVAGIVAYHGQRRHACEKPRGARRGITLSNSAALNPSATAQAALHVRRSSFANVTSYVHVSNA
jgi:hypothetical protein